MAEQWVHTELCFYNLVEIRTRAFGAVCISVCVCVHVCACMCTCTCFGGGCCSRSRDGEERRKGEQALRFLRN